MFTFSVIFFGPLLVQGIELRETSDGLNFDVNQEYATSYGNYKPSNYKFEYGVSDPHTGDHKSHWEIKENGVVRGEYRLLEPDGTTRIVQYTADDHNGFKATVRKIGKAIHPSNVHYSSVVQDIPVLSGLHDTYKSEHYFKTYDGSVENYINTIPIQVPYHEGGKHQDLLPHTITDHYGLSEIEPIGILHKNPHRIPNPLPLQELKHWHVPPVGIIKKEEYISNHIEQPAYTPENTPLDYSKYILPPVLNHESVYSPPHVSANNEYLPSSIHAQNWIDYPANTFVRHSPLVEPLSFSLRINHPHGESSSSFHSSTGNIRDDSGYTSYIAAGSSSGW